MYALSKTLLEPMGEYRVEWYKMVVLSHEVDVDVYLNIFGEEGNELYSASYDITTDDDKYMSGAISNRGTKEATIQAVEEAVLESLELLE